MTIWLYWDYIGNISGYIMVNDITPIMQDQMKHETETTGLGSRAGGYEENQVEKEMENEMYPSITLIYTRL